MARERLVYKTALSLATIATSGLVRLVFSLLVGHVFGKSMLGHASVIVSATVFATLLCSPGLGQSVARQMATRGLSAHDGAGRSLLVRATAAHHAICAVVAVGVGIVAPASTTVEHVLAAALTFAYGCYTYYKAVLYGVDYVRRYAVLELTWDALFLVALIAVVARGAHGWVLAPMVLVYGGFSIGAHRVLLRRRRRALVDSPVTVSSSPGPSGEADPAGPPAWWRAIGVYALVITLGTASSAGFLQLSQVFAARAGGDHGAGLFAAALSLVTPANLLPRAISVVLFPAMARAAGRSDHGQVRLHLTVGTDVLAAALLPAFALVGVLATAVLGVAYGRAYVDGGATFAIMVWATWVSVASVPAVNALSSDTSRAYLVPAGASVAGFAVGLVLWWVAGRSIEMVAWGYLIGSVIQSAVPMIEAARRHRAPGIGFVLRVVAVAAVGLAAALWVGPFTIGPKLVVAVVVTAFAGVTVWPELRGLARMSLARELR